MNPPDGPGGRAACTTPPWGGTLARTLRAGRARLRSGRMRQPAWSGGLALVSEEPALVERDLKPIASHILQRHPDWRVGALSLAELEEAIGPCAWPKPRVLVNLHPLPERAKAWAQRVFCGVALPKSQEMSALERIGLPVPRWRLPQPGEKLSETEFGPYVVVKPDEGLRGAGVRIMKASKAAAMPIHVQFNSRTSAALVQEFIYTGPQPVSYRVGVLFGKAIYRWRAEARPVAGRELPADGNFRTHSGAPIVSSGMGSRFTDPLDPEIVALAEQAAAAFPDIPLLGVDIVRRAGDGRLFILEVNASGYCFHITSDLGRKIQESMGLDFPSQYGGYPHVAELYARHYARVAKELQS